MKDLHAVLDAVGSERTALFAISEGGPMSVLFAATYPERTSALIVYGSYPKILPDRDYFPEREAWAEERIDQLEDV